MRLLFTGKPLLMKRSYGWIAGWGEGCVAAQPHRVLSIRVLLMPAKWFYRAVVMPYWFAFGLSIEQRVVEHVRLRELSVLERCKSQWRSWYCKHLSPVSFKTVVQ